MNFESPEIIKLLNLILLSAIKENASELHISAHKGGRILLKTPNGDDELQSLSLDVCNCVIARLKVMAGLDLESTASQRGRIELTGLMSMTLDVSATNQDQGDEVTVTISAPFIPAPATNPQLPEPGEGIEEIRALNDIITHAADREATELTINAPNGDIHITGPLDTGTSSELRSLDATALPKVVTRLKLMAGIDITNKTTPQRGRIRLTIRSNDLELKVATIPGPEGESIKVTFVR